MKGCVIIPTFNEAKTISRIVKEIKKRSLDVLVIDDGSTDGTETLAGQAGAEVIKQTKNMGKGISLRAGIDKAISRDYNFIITMDGDGQHHPDDIDSFIKFFNQNDVDIIVGNRMNDPKNMPLLRWTTNKILSMVISSACTTYIPDTQCGFRLINKSALRNIALSTSNYEIESELLIEATKKKYKIASVPIKSIYEGQHSEINPVVDTVRFFKFIFKDRIRESYFVIKEFFRDVFPRKNTNNN